MVTRLVARELRFAYTADAPVIEDVNLELRKGELACILGPNGAGKSTLLRLLAGLHAPNAGRVLLDGQGLEPLRPRERAREISLVPQGLTRVPQMLVRDFVLGGRYGHLGRFGRSEARDHEVVRESLEVCDAAEFAERELDSLSGGQLQRILIARALAQEAEHLLVDEPTNSLDPEHQLGVFELLRELTDAGRASLVVTHDMNLASQFAHEIHLLQGGRFVASGTAKDVLRPEVLEPVYGEKLRYGTFPTAAGERPFVLPWKP